MLRVVVGVVVVVVVAGAAPVPKNQPKDPEYLAGVRPGAKWEYDCGPKVGDAVMVLDTVEQKGSARVFTFANKDVLTVSADGLHQGGRFGFAYDPPRRLLPLPAKAGETWTTTTTFRRPGGEVVLKETGTVAGAEWVAVPAGRYWAVKVEYKGTQDGRPSSGADWYNPEVGLVKQEYPGQTVVLKSFTPGTP